MRPAIAFGALLLTACGSAVQSYQFRGPDGSSDWWSIECRGHTVQCWREAGEVCPSGYAVVDRTSHDDSETRTVVGGGGFAPVVATSRTTTITNGEVTIKCKGPSLAHKTDPACQGPENLRVGCLDPPETSPRHFVADDPREQRSK